MLQIPMKIKWENSFPMEDEIGKEQQQIQIDSKRRSVVATAAVSASKKRAWLLQKPSYQNRGLLSEGNHFLICQRNKGKRERNCYGVQQEDIYNSKYFYKEYRNQLTLTMNWILRERRQMKRTWKHWKMRKERRKRIKGIYIFL